MKLFDELKKYCDNNGIILQIDVFRKDKNRYELTLDNFSPEELKDIRRIIKDYAKIEDDIYLAGNGRAIDIYFEKLDESKKSARKSIKESENYVNYIAVYDEDSNCCGYIQNEDGGITQTISNALYFKNENEANTLRSKLIKRKIYDGDELYIEGRYINESKKSARKSLKESKIMSYKDFQDVCIEESENDIINFQEYKGAYFVILRTEEECERLLRVLCDKYRFEGTCYKIIDPYNPNYKCYEIMCV